MENIFIFSREFFLPFPFLFLPLILHPFLLFFFFCHFKKWILYTKWWRIFYKKFTRLVEKANSFSHFLHWAVSIFLYPFFPPLYFSFSLCISVFSSLRVNVKKNEKGLLYFYSRSFLFCSNSFIIFYFNYFFLYFFLIWIKKRKN